MNNNIENKNVAKPGFAVALANHWSYIGIGWTMGIESCVMSLNDSMAVTDDEWGIRTCINMDAAAYVLINESFPEVIDRLKKYIKAGKVEIVGGTYSQALGTMIGNESNIRQITIGREVIKKILDEDVDTFLEEEEFSHPQLAQILKSAGYKYASLAQCDTWGSSGIPHVELCSFLLKAKDGTVIPCIPKNSIFLHPPYVTADVDFFDTLEGSQKIEDLKKTGVPLAVVWTEFGWEPLGEQNINKFDPEKYKKLKAKNEVAFMTINEYMKSYAEPEKEILFCMDDYDKVLPWGIGGDQVRVNDRKGEALLITAEQLDVFAFMQKPHEKFNDIECAWKDLLTAQSHDVTLCEYSRWQGGTFVARDRVIDTHQMPWGTIGYTHLDKAISVGEKMLSYSLDTIISRINSVSDANGELAITIFNPCSWERNKVLVSTGKVYLKDVFAKGVLVFDAQGNRLPSQIVSINKNPDESILTIDLAFEVEKIPAAGYITYYLRYNDETSADFYSGVKINKQELEIENEYIKLRIDEFNGNIVSLFDKYTDKELLSSEKNGFATFNGRPNKKYCNNFDLNNVPECFNTSSSKAEISWIEEGPLKASICVLHKYSHVSFEMLITVHSNSPKVNVVCRLSASIPPAVDKNEVNGWQFENVVNEGYWLDFAPGFEPVSVYRDIPFGVESSIKNTFHGFSFIDLVGDDRALMLVHSGTQYFKVKEGNVFSNLLMREWESVFTRTFGWHPYCEYRYVLIPHSTDISNQERLRMSMETDYNVLTRVNIPMKGILPKQDSFLSVNGDGITVSSFRRVDEHVYELRLFETEGKTSNGIINLPFTLKDVFETDIAGRRIIQIAFRNKSFEVFLKPWQIATYQIYV